MDMFQTKYGEVVSFHTIFHFCCYETVVVLVVLFENGGVLMSLVQDSSTVTTDPNCPSECSRQVAASCLLLVQWRFGALQPWTLLRILPCAPGLVGCQDQAKYH